MTNTDVAIAGHIRKWRERRSLTREQLAALCSTHGEPGLTAEVIVNIEGRKKASGLTYRGVTPWELMVLARSLEVAPLQLMFDIGDSDSATVPGTAGAFETRAADAAMWFSGERAEPVDILSSAELQALIRDITLGKTDERLPSNDAGPLTLIRVAGDYRSRWAASSQIVEIVIELYNKAETATARDMYRGLARHAFDIADTWWMSWDQNREHLEKAMKSELPPRVFRSLTAERDRLRTQVDSLGDDDA